jgi:hypothetical protein
MDLYPDVPLAAGVIKPGTVAHRIFDRLDRFCRHADKVVVLGRCMRERVLAKGIDTRRVAIARGSAYGNKPTGLAPNAFRTERDIGDRLVIEYSGNRGV